MADACLVGSVPTVVLGLLGSDIAPPLLCARAQDRPCSWGGSGGMGPSRNILETPRPRDGLRMQVSIAVASVAASPLGPDEGFTRPLVQCVGLRTVMAPGRACMRCPSSLCVPLPRGVVAEMSHSPPSCGDVVQLEKRDCRRTRASR